MVTFYQMLLHLGTLNGTRILGPRTVQYVTRNHTGDRLDERFGIPMHRGLGVHVRGTTPTIRGLGSTASPNTFGHGGAGTSYSWADPETGVSFTYLTNSQLPEPLHGQRLDEITTLAHAAVVEL
jgi:CubicO group peptidase (beta-lactamase class C family)